MGGLTWVTIAGIKVRRIEPGRGLRSEETAVAVGVVVLLAILAADEHALTVDHRSDRDSSRTEQVTTDRADPLLQGGLLFPDRELCDPAHVCRNVEAVVLSREGLRRRVRDAIEGVRAVGGEVRTVACSADVRRDP